jgi:hypothetical protein
MRELLRETRAERKPETQPWEEALSAGGKMCWRPMPPMPPNWTAGPMPIARTRRQDLRAELEAVLAQRRAAEAAKRALPHRRELNAPAPRSDFTRLTNVRSKK